MARPEQGRWHVARKPDVGVGGQQGAATGPAKAYIFRELHEHQERVEGEPLVPAAIHHETPMPPRKLSSEDVCQERPAGYSVPLDEDELVSNTCTIQMVVVKRGGCRLTLERMLPDATQWSTRAMAKRSGPQSDGGELHLARVRRPCGAPLAHWQ